MKSVRLQFQHTAARRRLLFYFCKILTICCFNTQPPEGGCNNQSFASRILLVSTHSRPKAAAWGIVKILPKSLVSTHSRPKAAAWGIVKILPKSLVSTHSRPKAAAEHNSTLRGIFIMFQHTAARRRLHNPLAVLSHFKWFQHTAARRRLLFLVNRLNFIHCFNTQPPEGGCNF